MPIQDITGQWVNTSQLVQHNEFKLILQEINLLADKCTKTIIDNSNKHSLNCKLKRQECIADLDVYFWLQKAQNAIYTMCHCQRDN